MTGATKIDCEAAGKVNIRGQSLSGLKTVSVDVSVKKAVSIQP